MQLLILRRAIASGLRAIKILQFKRLCSRRRRRRRRRRSFRANSTRLVWQCETNNLRPRTYAKEGERRIAFVLTSAHKYCWDI